MLRPLLVAVIGVAILSAGMWFGFGRRSSPTGAGTPTPDDGATSWYPRAPGEPNKLAGARTPFLQEASQQPVNWHEWGPEAFALASQLDRPILLDIGASWCAACDLMDMQSYSDPGVAAILNGHFIPVRVDRDARPDLDYRYQSMAQALGQPTGWPLTVVLTPDGLPYAGAGYLPAVGTNEEASLKDVLQSALAAYRDQRADVLARAQMVAAAAAESERELAKPGESTAGVEETIQAAIVGTFDSLNGGWGAGAKTASGPIVAYLLESYAASQDERRLALATQTLDAIANGSLFDHVMGGLFRMTADAHWREPLYEKLGYIQADGIANYARAYELTAEPRYREAASAIIEYVQTRFSDQPRGGFYASQAAHTGRGVDDYYSWTPAEAEAALTPEQASVLLPHFGIQNPPSRPLADNPERSVLHIARPARELAEEMGQPLSAVEGLIATGRQRMAESRDRQRAPELDRTLLTSWNGRMISAYVLAGRVLDRPVLTDFAVRTADRFLATVYQPGQPIGRGIAEGGNLSPPLLEDQVLFAQALLDLHEATGQERYLTAARDLFDTARKRFASPDAGGWLDVVAADDPVARLPLVCRPILDSTTASANAVAALVGLRLAQATGDLAYRRAAESILLAFAGSAENLGAMAPSYALAVLRASTRPAATSQP